VSLRDRVQTDITTAMRGGDSLRRDVLRMASNAAYNVEKRNQRPLSEDEYLAVLTREVKTRRESVDAYTKAAGTILPRKSRPRSTSLSEYLPQALTERRSTRSSTRGSPRRAPRALVTSARSWAGSRLGPAGAPMGRR
jgi:uncharacterized protein YqeY